MKLGGWIVMITTMIIILSFIGVNTSLSPLVSNLGINITDAELQKVDIESSSLWERLFSESAIEIFGVEFDTGGILIALLGGTIIIGFLAKGYDVSLILLPIVIFFLSIFVSSFASIISYINDFHNWWMTSMVVIIFGALMVGFVMSGIDYFGGR